MMPNHWAEGEPESDALPVDKTAVIAAVADILAATYERAHYSRVADRLALLTPGDAVAVVIGLAEQALGRRMPHPGTAEGLVRMWAASAERAVEHEAERGLEWARDSDGYL